MHQQNCPPYSTTHSDASQSAGKRPSSISTCPHAGAKTNDKSWQGLYSSLNGWRAPAFRFADKVRVEAPYISGFTTFSPTALGWQTSAQPAHGDRWLALGTREGIEVRHLHQACHAHPTSWLPGALMEGGCMRTGWVHDHCRCACQINTIDPCQEGATDAVLARFTGEVAGGPLSLAALPNNALVSGGAHDGTLTFFKVEGAAIRQSVILAALMCVLACSCGRCRKSARFHPSIQSGRYASSMPVHHVLATCKGTARAGERP